MSCNGEWLLQTEIEQLKKRISDLEMKNARTVHDVRPVPHRTRIVLTASAAQQGDQRVGDAHRSQDLPRSESITSFLWPLADFRHQDELETEVTRLKDKLARSQKKSSKGPADEPRSSITSSSSHGSIFSSGTTALGEDVCELCERPGHDAFNCDMLKEGRSSALGSNDNRDSKIIDLYCVDCEGHGHTADNCPHSMDVF